MKKKSSLADRFQEDYTAVVTPCDNKDGFKIDYVYYSPWYIWDLPEAELKKQKKIILIECIGIIVAFLLTAVMKTELNSLSFVAFPALFSLCTLVFVVFGVGQFYFAKHRATKSTYNEANRRLRVCTVINGVCASFATGGCVYYILKFQPTIADVAVMLCYGAVAVLSFLIRKQYVNIPFTTEKNDILNHVERATMT